MKDYAEFLSAREIYILENYPGKNLKVLGEELGISNVRVQKLTLPTAKAGGFLVQRPLPTK